jgi:hypothetical protein
LRAYITLLGRSVWALLNTYYAVLREQEYFPDKIRVLTEASYEGRLDIALEGLGILSDAFGFSPEMVSETVGDSDFLGAGRKISGLVRELKGEGYSVALDVTPGRKILVAGALVATAGIDLDHVFYLALDSLDDVAKPYAMIPFQRQTLQDLTSVPGVIP